MGKKKAKVVFYFTDTASHPPG